MAENILIIDDQVTNLQLLTKMLEKEGYVVRPVTNGDTAIQTARFDAPDLILLDINMPGMDGYQVCEKLKQDDLLKEIPVIFLTASDQTVDKVRAFSVGGIDYITKPFNLEEVKVRIQTHLTIGAQKRSLQLKTEQLEAGYARLRDLEQLKDDLVNMIVHDMRNIVQGITGYLQLFSLAGAKIAEEKQRHYISQALGSADDLISMMNSLLDISRIEQGAMNLNIKPCEVNTILDHAMRQVSSMRGSRNIIIETPERTASVMCDPDITGRILLNLLHNAIKFTADNGQILAGFETLQNMVRLYVRDNGPGIPHQFHARIFEKFVRYEKNMPQNIPQSTGLGLAFCKLGTEIQGGRIGVESAEGEGSTFWLMLPASNN